MGQAEGVGVAEEDGAAQRERRAEVLAQGAEVARAARPAVFQRNGTSRYRLQKVQAFQEQPSVRRTTSARYWSGGRMPTGPLAARKRAASSRERGRVHRDDEPQTADGSSAIVSIATDAAAGARGAIGGPQTPPSGSVGPASPGPSACEGGERGVGLAPGGLDDRLALRRGEPSAQARGLDRRLALPQQPAVEAAAVGAGLTHERVGPPGEVPRRHARRPPTGRSRLRRGGAWRSERRGG